MFTFNFIKAKQSAVNSIDKKEEATRRIGEQNP